MTLKRAALYALARKDLYTFIQLCFLILHPGETFKENWHVELMTSELMAIWRGEERLVIFNLPPRNLKSFAISVVFVAWVLGMDPTRRFLVVSYGMELAEKLARDTRTIMQSPMYRAMFPATQISPQRTAAHDFETTLGGGRMASSRGGPITGRGAHYTIIDDALKADEAQTDTARQAVNHWVSSTLSSRGDDKMTGAMIIAMQRLHAEDLTGVMLKTGRWRHVCLPAIAPEDQWLRYATPWGERERFWCEGEALHPQREPLSVLRDVQAMQGEYHFNAQYLQNPVPLAGNLVKIESFNQYDQNSLPASFDETIFSIDTASKAKERSDHSVISYWGRKGKAIYLLNLWRFKATYYDLKQRILANIQTHRPNRILIEDSSSGQQLIQEFIRESVYGVKAVTPKGDKVMRMSHAGILIEGGDVYLPASAPWLGEYVRELAGFPNYGSDDQVDSTSQALNWFRVNLSEPNLTRFYREQAEMRANPMLGEVWVLKPPPAVGGVSAIDGTWYRLHDDGYFHLPKSDAIRLTCLVGWSLVRIIPGLGS